MKEFLLTTAGLVVTFPHMVYPAVIAAITAGVVDRAYRGKETP